MTGRVRRLEEVEAAAATCTNCDLYRNATQTVFGEGSVDAGLMLVGEQPGDEEDQMGSPFVGPAGRLLRKALADAEIDLATIYMTNVVKHFKWKATPSGWRRLHQKPNRDEVAACWPWFEAEVDLVKPDLIVGLGATACQAILGPQLKVTTARGKVFDWQGHPVFVTVHPSSVLRAGEERETQYQAFVRDLRAAGQAVSVAS